MSCQNTQSQGPMDQRVQPACGAREDGESPLHIGPRLRRSVHEAQAAGQVCQNGLQAHRRILRAGAGSQTKSRNAPVSRNRGLGSPAFGSVAGKIRIGRDGDFFPDFCAEAKVLGHLLGVVCQLPGAG
jgi:hypothetical protein